MKKKITSPDGTVTEYEGTPEELSKLEETIKKESSKKNEGKGNRRVLLVPTQGMWTRFKCGCLYSSQEGL